MIPSHRPAVIYHKHTTDGQLKILLERIAQVLGVNVTVHSGNRDFVPTGGAQKSLHLHHRAVDLHAGGLSDEQVFTRLKAHKSDLYDKNYSYQIIRHGPHTATEGPHIHIGDYGFLRVQVHGAGLTFFVEGMTPQTKGVYTVSL